MKKVVCALAMLAFIGSINVASADELMRFPVLMVILFMTSPYGDRNEFSLVQIDLELHYD